MAHVQYAGWHSEDGKPVFWCRIERTNGKNHAMVSFGRVPTWSSDSKTIVWVKAMSNDILVGKTAIVYVTAYGGFDRSEVIAIVQEELEKFRMRGN